MSCVAADIGGTNSRFAVIVDGQARVHDYANAGFADFYQLFASFLEQAGLRGASIEKIVLALPAPVSAGPVRLTNIDWEVDGGRLQEQFDLPEPLLVNDFQAAATGALASAQLRSLKPEVRREDSGAAVVTGAGTGLGLAWVADASADVLPRATEGGHTDFAPSDAQQRELHARLQQRHGHVSWERLLSGDGLCVIHAFLHGDAQKHSAAEIARAAEQGEPHARDAVRLFVRLFGAYAGNLALQFNPSAGVYLCGGVVAHLADWFGEDFLEAFHNKGRMRHMVEQVPIFLADTADLGLQGAIRIAQSMTGQ